MRAPTMEFEPEATQLTPVAYRETTAILGRVVEMALNPAEAQDGTPFYLHVMGQSSAGGHGKQGLHPDRVKALRHLDEHDRPVFMAFCEGVDSWHGEWFRVLDAQGPADCVYHGEDGDPTSRRWGWFKRRMRDGGANRPLRALWPPSGPPAVESGRLAI